LVEKKPRFKRKKSTSHGSTSWRGLDRFPGGNGTKLQTSAQQVKKKKVRGRGGPRRRFSAQGVHLGIICFTQKKKERGGVRGKEEKRGGLPFSMKLNSGPCSPNTVWGGRERPILTGCERKGVAPVAKDVRQKKKKKGKLRPVPKAGSGDGNLSVFLGKGVDSGFRRNSPSP